MGIDIYASWRNQSNAEKEAQSTGFRVDAGNVGYLREAYHGGPYVTHYLVSEAFEAEDGSAKIPASVLRERLPTAVAISLFREAKLYGGKKESSVISFENLDSKIHDLFSSKMKDVSHEEIAAKIDEKTKEHMKKMIDGGLLPVYAQSFVDFVVLCENKEKELGEPVEIEASY